MKQLQIRSMTERIKIRITGVKTGVKVTVKLIMIKVVAVKVTDQKLNTLESRPTIKVTGVVEVKVKDTGIQK